MEELEIFEVSADGEVMKKMRCVICNGGDIEEKEVEEEIRVGNDIVLVPAKAMVCRKCGERYYDRKTMMNLEIVKYKVDKKQLEVETIGNVLKISEVFT
jgi:YgiT-type zinc finger domain-containing protein